MFVRPSHQRQGIGRALMNKARSLHDVLELDVFAANPLGRAFYAQYGFVPIKEFVEEKTGEATLRLRYEAGELREKDGNEGESETNLRL